MSDEDEKVVTLVEGLDGTSGADVVLDWAKGKCRDVLVLGWDTDGALILRSSVGLGTDDCVYLLSKVNHKFLAGDYEAD